VSSVARVQDTQPSVERSEDAFSVTLQDLELVRAGLRRRPKHLPCKLFYDARGSQLFDDICVQPEYYPTRTETSILEDNVDEIVDALGEGCRLVELGSGSSHKTEVLLDALREPACYVPIDISGEHLNDAAERIGERYPDLHIVPVVADYTVPMTLPDTTESSEVRSTCAFFPGSTLGNFERQEAARFLRRVADLVGKNGSLLLGIDLRKDASIIEPAYNDAAGVTAEFNLNILHVLNEHADGDFDVDGFAHRAVYDPNEGRIEMRLISQTDQTASVAGEAFDFAKGEHIVTEYSHKFDEQGFAELARETGFTVTRRWHDSQSRFAVCLLVAD
jgi:dimethylhistidine N-methyltransferase